MARFLFRHLKGYRLLCGRCCVRAPSTNGRRPIHTAPIGALAVGRGWDRGGAPAVAEEPAATIPHGRGTR
jgi:hypothetical protein